MKNSYIIHKKLRDYGIPTLLYFCAIFINLFQPKIFAQTKKADSLKSIFQHSSNDSIRGLTLIELGIYYSSLSTDSSIFFLEKAIEIAQKHNYPTLLTDAYRNLAMSLDDKGDYLQALQKLKSALQISLVYSYEISIAKIYSNFGIVYRHCGDLDKALNFHFLSLKIREEKNDKKGIAANLNNIGVIYQDQKNYPEALKYHEKALRLKTELNDSTSITYTLNNLGLIKLYEKDYKKAFEYFEKALKIAEEIKDNNVIKFTLDNCVLLLIEKKEYNRALIKAMKALELCDKTKCGIQKIFSLLGITKVYLCKKDYEQALKYANYAYQLSSASHDKAHISESAKLIAEAHAAQENFQEAYKYLEIYRQYHDSVFNQEKNKEINLLTLRKKQADNLKLEEELRISDLKLNVARLNLHKRKILIIAISVGAFLSTALLILLILGRKNNRRHLKQVKEKNAEILEKNKILEKQKEELLTSAETEKLHHEEISQMYTRISQQNEILENQNLQIRESLNFARKAQLAMLPRKEYMNSLVPNFFIYFQPEHLVGGDFYYFRSLGDYLYISVAESNNANIPGVFISMLANAFLNEIIEKQASKNEDVSAANILEKFYKKFTIALNANSLEGEKLISLSICVLNQKKQILAYSSTNCPICLIQDNEIQNLIITNKPNKQSDAEASTFINREVKLHQNDSLYLFTNGIINQIGGPKKTILGMNRLRKIIQEINQLDVSDQYLAIEKEYQTWRGNNEQIDDILVMGLKIGC